MQFPLPIPGIILLLLIFSFFLSDCALAEIDPPVRIAFLSDLHYIAPSLTDHGTAFMQLINHADGKTALYCDELTEAFIHQVQTLNISALVLQGDLTFNGAVESHVSLASKLSVLREAGIPIYVIPGNHDVYNRNAARFAGSSYERVPSAASEDFARIWSDFGYSQALSRDSVSLSYTADLSSSLRLLMVDVNTEGNIGVLKEETLAWAEKELKQARKDHRHVLAVSHQNLLIHNTLFISGFRMTGAEKLEALYRQYGVLCNISGHMHAQHISGADNGLPEIAVSSAVVSPCQFGLLTLFRDEMEFHTKRIKVSEWAAEHGSSNPDLLDFSRYARDFFSAGMNRQAAATPEHLTPEQTKAQADYASRLNAAYFAGNLTEFSPQDRFYQQIVGESGMSSLYLKSIRPDLGKNYTELRYSFGGTSK